MCGRPVGVTLVDQEDDHTNASHAESMSSVDDDDDDNNNDSIIITDDSENPMMITEKGENEDMESPMVEHMERPIMEQPIADSEISPIAEKTKGSDEDSPTAEDTETTETMDNDETNPPTENIEEKTIKVVDDKEDDDLEESTPESDNCRTPILDSSS